MLEFFRSHTADTVFQRYGYQLAELTTEHARRLLRIDQVRDVALAVVEPHRTGNILHAVGRYYTEPDEVTAETAFVVRETMRRRGLATRLLLTLGNIARAHGIQALRAQVLANNFAMKHLLSAYTPLILTPPAGEVTEYLVPIAHLSSPAAQSAEEIAPARIATPAR